MVTKNSYTFSNERFNHNETHLKQCKESVNHPCDRQDEGSVHGGLCC